MRHPRNAPSSDFRKPACRACAPVLKNWRWVRACGRTLSQLYNCFNMTLSLPRQIGRSACRAENASDVSHSINPCWSLLIPPTGRSGCGSNMGQISVKTYATNGSLLNDNQQPLLISAAISSAAARALIREFSRIESTGIVVIAVRRAPYACCGSKAVLKKPLYVARAAHAALARFSSSRSDRSRRSS